MASDAYLPQTPSPNPSTSVSALATAHVRANAMSFSTAEPATSSSPIHSDPLRKPSSPSNTLAGRSFGFASDRSPLQKLELELKHISKEESDTPSLGRSLSKRQEERLQRSTTITSRLTASPTSTSSSRGYPKFEDDRHHNHHHNNSGRGNRQPRMAHLLGSLHQPEKEPKENGRDRNDYYETVSNHEDRNRLQTIYNAPPASQDQISGSNRVGRKAHHDHHGYQFQHIRQQGSSGSGSSGVRNPRRVTQAAGGQDVFQAKVAHLALEDRELNSTDSTHGGDAAADDGMIYLYQEGHIPIAQLDAPSNIEYPSSFVSFSSLLDRTYHCKHLQLRAPFLIPQSLLSFKTLAMAIFLYRGAKSSFY